MFSEALAAHKSRQAKLNTECAVATAAAKRAAQELATAAVQERNRVPEAIFHTQQRIGAEFKATRKWRHSPPAQPQAVHIAAAQAAARPERGMAAGWAAGAALPDAYEALCKILGSTRQLRAACPRLFRDIVAVLSGLRCGCMVDYAAVAPHQLAAAAASVAACLRMAAAGVCVVGMVDCAYLVQPQLLPCCCSVDDGQLLGGQPPAPLLASFDGARSVRWASVAEAAAAMGKLAAFRSGLLQAVHAASGAAAIPVVAAASIPGWQGLAPPTASGYLLGFPAIYLCHSLEGAQAASRCLSSGSLCLHTVRCVLAAHGVPAAAADQPLLAFSLPAQLAAAPAWMSCWEAWRTRLHQQHGESVQRVRDAREAPQGDAKGGAMRLEKCWFCSSTCYPGHGITFVRNDATIFRFCRSKCHKNFKMKRNPRKVKWTKAYRKLAGKELAEDATFEMERRRNRPEKYDRELVHKTVKAIQKVEAVRTARQDRFYDKRMQRARVLEKAADRKQLEQEIHLVKAPGALAAEKEKKLRVAVEEEQFEEGMQE
ncbi:hypothetical protein D9Q98_003451 [Chlorella vulgaris]|uniref:TRASH domain-containing protein n=1 Tax=Chlorella vulgaris TaxID=3077 RepID=A0A9D4TSS8_CHLVU|nr:hypothetical protein D9Q98_003451 [Chlorella vulgaris]